MNKDKKVYYIKKADSFGWGTTTAKLDEERISLLEKYVKGSKVLDIGCATGVYVDYFVGKGKRVVGIDFVKEFIEYAKKYRKGEFLVANAYSLPFPDGSFDTVLMMDLLEHLEDEERALKEAIRVTKKRIILILPRRTDSFLEKSGLIFRHHLDATHLRVYTEKKVKKLLSKIELKLICLEPIHPVSGKELFLYLLSAPVLIKKIIRKLFFSVFEPVNFYSSFFVVGEK